MPKKISSVEDRVKTNQQGVVNQLLIDDYQNTLKPYGEEMSTLHLILQLRNMNKLLEQQGVLEIFYASKSSTFKLLSMAEQEAVRPLKRDVENIIRKQAVLECRPELIKSYDDLVDVKNYIGLPYALLEIPYPNSLVTLSDATNEVVTPLSSSSPGNTHLGQHPDMDALIEDHNQFFEGMSIPPLTLSAPSMRPRPLTFKQLNEARMIL